MGRPQIPAHVIAARGVPLTLLDNRQVTLCYTFRALMDLEELYGSLPAVAEVLNDVESGKAFTQIAQLMAPALDHETTDHGKLSELDVLADYLDPAKIGTYGEAIGEAFTKAFPQAAAAAGGEGDTDPSRGLSSTTSPGSGSDSPMQSSGG